MVQQECLAAHDHWVIAIQSASLESVTSNPRWWYTSILPPVPLRSLWVSFQHYHEYGRWEFLSSVQACSTEFSKPIWWWVHCLHRKLLHGDQGVDKMSWLLLLQSWFGLYFNGVAATLPVCEYVMVIHIADFTSFNHLSPPSSPLSSTSSFSSSSTSFPWICSIYKACFGEAKTKTDDQDTWRSGWSSSKMSILLCSM